MSTVVVEPDADGPVLDRSMDPWVEKAKARRSWLVGSVLYCSKLCAQLAGGPEERARGGRRLRDGEFETAKFGALCPHCGDEYPEF